MFWRQISRHFKEKIEAMWTISFKTLFQNKSENPGNRIHARGFYFFLEFQVTPFTTKTCLFSSNLFFSKLLD